MEYRIDKEEIHIVMENNNIRTQSELASLLGITKNQLSVLLSPKSNPIKSNYQKLFDVLQVNPVDVLVPRAMTEKKIQYMTPELAGEYVDTATVKASRPYRSVELFAGAGGLALGLERAGFCAQGLVELDKYAAATLRKNRPYWNVIEDDIVRVAEAGIKNHLTKGAKIDFVSGGYPCQSFSYAGHKLGLDDVRGTMFFYFAKIVKELQPTVFLAENVRGLVSHDDGKTLATMIEIYENLGYNVSWHVVKAVDYGVAQKRERVIIVGVRKGLPVKYRLPERYSYRPVLRDVLQDVPDSLGENTRRKKQPCSRWFPPGDIGVICQKISPRSTWGKAIIQVVAGRVWHGAFLGTSHV